MLKRIIFLLSESCYHFITPLKDIITQKVSPQGVNIRFIPCADICPEDTSAPNYSSSCAHMPQDGICADHADTLFITDDPKTFSRLQNAGLYTLVLYHEYNRSCSFPDAMYGAEDISQLEYRSYDEVYRRLAGIPWDILETERLFVRETIVADLPSFYRIYENPSITAYTEGLYTDPQEEAAYLQDYIKQIYGFYGFGIWTVILKETGKIIGKAGLNVRQGYALPELGFVIDADHQRQGLGYEVCHAILEYAKHELEFQKVQALVKERNIPSLKLLEKLGFSYERNVFEKGQDYLLYTCQLSSIYKNEA